MRKTILSALCLSLLFLHAPSVGHARTINETNDTSADPKIAYEDWHDAKRSRDLPVKIYLPRSGAAPYPVVIFSHGLGGSREAAVYLGNYWSQHGYACVFVQHPGSDTSVWQPAAADGKEAFLQRMRAAANAKNLIDRVGDVKFVIDQLEQREQTDPLLKHQLNLNEIAVAGHSFGAGTALAVAGQTFPNNINVQDKRIKSALYLCPPVRNGNTPADQVYGSITIPGMLLTGTEDTTQISDTKAEDRRIPFDGMKSPHQYLVNFTGADHAVFGGRSFRPPKDSDENFHRMIEQITTEFLDATLKNDRAAWQWLDSSEATTYLGKAAEYERK